MIDLDERLDSASRAIRSQVNRVPMRPPSEVTCRHRRGRTISAVMGIVVVMAAVGAPGLFFTERTEVASGPSAGLVETVPYLILDLPDTHLVEAYDIRDEATGERIGAHAVYLQRWRRSDGTEGRREILLRVQRPGNEFARFDELITSAETIETLTVAGRDVTVYVIPDEAIEEGAYDLGVLQWTESPGYQAILIPWGLDRGDALQLMKGLESISASDWEGLTLLSDEERATTITTTIVRPEAASPGETQATPVESDPAP